MKCIQGIQLISGSNEELLPDFQTDFPYIATCAELYKYLSPEIPWHWHSTAELFYRANIRAARRNFGGGAWQSCGRK